ncbi:MAG TPA: 4Fe-4S binding protein [bacterium]|nr:4Fe-4S binding protein [bacterium]HPS31646.1 4Fe-4S binding protein [bacterium]
MHKINPNLCTSCGLCASECPTEAIIEGTNAYKITESCVDCGSCVPVCPVEAISG